MQRYNNFVTIGTKDSAVFARFPKKMCSHVNVVIYNNVYM